MNERTIALVQGPAALRFVALAQYFESANSHLICLAVHLGCKGMILFVPVMLEHAFAFCKGHSLIRFHELPSTRCKNTKQVLCDK